MSTTICTLDKNSQHVPFSSVCNSYSRLLYIILYCLAFLDLFLLLRSTMYCVLSVILRVALSIFGAGQPVLLDPFLNVIIFHTQTRNVLHRIDSGTGR